MRRSKPLRTLAAYCLCCLNPLLARLVSRPVVLCFHRVKEPSGSLLDRRVGVTAPDSFEGAVRYMKVLGYRFVSLEEVVKRASSSKPARVAAITFDDGFKDLFQNAYPILKRRRIPFALFLVTRTAESKQLLWLHKLYVALDRLSPVQATDILRRHGALPDDREYKGGSMSLAVSSMDRGGIEKLAEELAAAAHLSAGSEGQIAEDLYLTKAELSEMEAHGLSIEAHGHEHVPLANKSETETEEEIARSVRYIAQELHGKPLFYSLPFGAGNRYVRQIVKALGLTGMTTTEPRLIRPREDPYDVPRVCISGDDSILYLALGLAYLDVLAQKLRIPARIAAPFTPRTGAPPK
jgi:peptidoglycan/xylan/chitin deacetylase (PgdA/CDA1 family)